MDGKALVIYIHGKGGNAAEGAHYGPLFPGCDVLGFDYHAKTPWEAQTEFPAFFGRWSRGYERVILVASSIGAYFSMMSLGQEKIEKAYFISPIVDMEKLICNMMLWANVSEGELREKGTIETAFGETLSWEYLSYVRTHPVRWPVPTEILYGAKDNLTGRDTIAAFALAHGAGLTVMESGEHWFHTPEQMAFLDDWIAAIKTARLLLRPWRESDAENLFQYASDPAVGPIAGWPPHKSVGESRHIIQTVLNGPECYAICERNGGAAIGSIELRLNGHTDLADKDDECELGFWVGRPFWGRGFVPEAAGALLRRAFETLGMARVWCAYYDGNEKSRRAQEKIGFVYHHSCAEVSVPQMNEIRLGHTNVMTREDWIGAARNKKV